MSALDSHMEATVHVHRAPGECLVRTHDDGVGARHRPECVERLPGCDAQATALTRREAPVACVTTEHASRDIDNASFTGTKAPSFEKGAIVVSSEEARLLALRLPCSR